MTLVTISSSLQTVLVNVANVLLLCFTILCMLLSLHGLRVTVVLYLRHLVFLHFGVF